MSQTDTRIRELTTQVEKLPLPEKEDPLPLELSFIKYLDTRSKYDKYHDFIHPNSLSSTARALLECLGEVYKTSEKVTDWSDLLVLYGTLHPSAEADDYAQIEVAINDMLTKDESGTKSSILSSLINREHAGMVSDICDGIYANGTLTTDEYQKVIDCVENWKDAHAKYTDDFKVISVEDALNTHTTKVHARFPITAVDRMLGGLRKGDFIIVGARPDGGKTTLLASLATHTAASLGADDGPILWFNNEEPLSRVYTRQIQSLLNWTYQEVHKDMKVTMKEWYAKGGNNIITIDDNTASIFDIEKYCNKYQPHLIIIDQLLKVNGYETHHGTEADRYRKIAERIRYIAKKHAPVVGTSWLGDNAEECRYPSMGTLYGSRTGLQGEADAILMLGVDSTTPDVRYFHAPKNKLPYAEPKYRNSKVTVKLYGDRARFGS